MDLKSYVEEIKLRLTGNLLELEIDDETIAKVIYSAFREIQRYIDLTVYETVPFSSCIDLSPRKVNAVTQVMRATALANATSDEETTSTTYTGLMQDPIYLSQWAGIAGNYGYSNYALNNYVTNYLAYTTATQIRNTLSTDMAFRYDRASNRLYINASAGTPTYVTIKYVPRFDDPSEIYSDYWIDMLVKLAVATTKVILGRLRTRYTQSNALWTQDGETILSEGKAELDAIRAELKESTQLFYPVD